MLVQFFNPLTAMNYPSWLNFNLRKQVEIKKQLVEAIVATWEGYAELIGITTADDEVQVAANVQ
jgi:hypothetical protein